MTTQMQRNTSDETTRAQARALGLSIDESELGSLTARAASGVSDVDSASESLDLQSREPAIEFAHTPEGSRP